MDSIYILYFIPIIMIVWIIVAISDKKKEKQEFEELQNTPIEVYRYTYKIYLNDGSNYTRVANAFCSVDFEEFVKRVLLEDTTLELEDGLVINIENITKTKPIGKEIKIIKPKVNKCYDLFYLSKGYSVEEVLEREIKE